MEPLIIGAVGGAIILIAYLLELFEHIDPYNKAFLAANIIGSALLAYYAYFLNSIPFLILNAAWVLGSVYELIKNWK
ncbi:MAG: hypothetical protein QXM31_00990 [Candidatus Woesearchaeota archaeon]